MRISDWSSDVCSSDLRPSALLHKEDAAALPLAVLQPDIGQRLVLEHLRLDAGITREDLAELHLLQPQRLDVGDPQFLQPFALHRSEEHTSELQSLMRISYAVFCLKNKTKHTT